MSMPTEDRPAMMFSQHQPPQFMVNPVSLMLMAGAIVYGTLYLVLVFVLGLIVGSKWAMVLAIAAAGVTYLSFFLQLLGGSPQYEPNAAIRAAHLQDLARVTVYFSIALGILAVVPLLFR